MYDKLKPVFSPLVSGIIIWKNRNKAFSENKPHGLK